MEDPSEHRIRDSNGNSTQVFLRKDSSIVLGASSVGCPAIFMHSGVYFQYFSPSIRDVVGSMKFESYVRLKIWHYCRCQYGYRFFLPSFHASFSPLIVALVTPTPLNAKNTIELDSKGESALTAGRDHPFSNNDQDVRTRRLTKGLDALQIELRPTDPDDNNDWDDDNFLKTLELGGVAHEPGTIPLKGFDHKRRFFVYKNLMFRVREGVYVCNLPNFPMVTNPTLTLVTLTLRLSKTILPRTVPVSDEGDVVYVMNQTGDRIKVFISNHAGVKMR
ncbi:hypothetical protein K435DRAFT_844779 [Dendrothele bispora CBS 962.96]|uniref:Uncharacterized protein n=1 Tax=Dendrothele bispora (strain CBS 962.96) TaxID=1314807 RepID=A0A4V6T504_DENBC|nr:hypothetical protein K435DRAFT_844779 [Dendrothele bispora CBS 962.96]